MFLKGKDYLSIWEVAHKWAGIDPDSTDNKDLPEEVSYLIHKIIEGYLHKRLRLRRLNGYMIPYDSAFLIFFDINRWRVNLLKCLFDDVFDKKRLSNYFVKRAELLELCRQEDLDPPEFWSKKNNTDSPQIKANINNRPKDEMIDRLVCQAIARTYWDIDPQIHPAHMAKARAILLYANGRQYKDENTIKGWISEIDPIKDQRKIGRPKDVTYLIDLENGVLPLKRPD